MMQRLSKKQIDELDAALMDVLRWSVTYSHLACLERAASLGLRAVHDLRTLRHVPLEDAGANLRPTEEPAA